VPLPPYHLGPGILVKALLRGSFSLIVFGWAQVVTDLQPLIAILTGYGQRHGFTHTYLGATLVALFCAPTGKFLCEWVLGALPLTPRGPVRVSWGVAWLSAFLGSYSHVLIDSIVHADVHPLAPVTSANWLLDLISPAALHGVLVCSGLVGTALYVAVSVVVTRRRERSRRAHGVACGGGGSARRVKRAA